MSPRTSPLRRAWISDSTRRLSEAETETGRRRGGAGPLRSTERGLRRLHLARERGERLHHAFAAVDFEDAREAEAAVGAFLEREPLDDEAGVHALVVLLAVPFLLLGELELRTLENVDHLVRVGASGFFDRHLVDVHVGVRAFRAVRRRELVARA